MKLKTIFVCFILIQLGFWNSSFAQPLIQPLPITQVPVENWVYSSDIEKLLPEEEVSEAACIMTINLDFLPSDISPNYLKMNINAKIISNGSVKTRLITGRSIKEAQKLAIIDKWKLDHGKLEDRLLSRMCDEIIRENNEPKSLSESLIGFLSTGTSLGKKMKGSKQTE